MQNGDAGLPCGPRTVCIDRLIDPA
jgi:hypothetical protein